MRIDAHRHVWDLAARPQPWTSDIPQLNKSFTIDELRLELRLHRIDATIVVQTVPVAAETPDLIGSDWPVCLLAASYGDVIGAADALTAALSPAEHAPLFGGTAACWYGIPAC